MDDERDTGDSHGWPHVGGDMGGRLLAAVDSALMDMRFPGCGSSGGSSCFDGRRNCSNAFLKVEAVEGRGDFRSAGMAVVEVAVKENDREALAVLAASSFGGESTKGLDFFDAAEAGGGGGKCCV